MKRLICLCLFISLSANEKQDKIPHLKRPPRPLYLDMGKLPKRKKRFTQQYIKRIRDKIFGKNRPSTNGGKKY